MPANDLYSDRGLPAMPDPTDIDPPVIDVHRTDVEQFLSRFSVNITDAEGNSEHIVTLSGTDYERLGRGYRSPEELIRASVAFLLEREPKEQILRSFDVSQISTYFPDFERAIDRPPDTA